MNIILNFLIKKILILILVKKVTFYFNNNIYIKFNAN